MGFHTFDVGNVERLEDPMRYRYLSREELVVELSPSPSDVIADVGSGTGFYTDDVAPHVAGVKAVDLQPEMHAYYREKGVPENVELVTAGAEDLPFPDGSLDGVVSTMTYHEFASEAALSELARIVRQSARVVVADWTANGEGQAGPPLAERFTADEAVDAFTEAGFDVITETERLETFIVTAQIP